jgi:hypothetical protein
MAVDAAPSGKAQPDRLRFLALSAAVVREQDAKTP